MKAIDTNVLVRIIVRDDEMQARRALKYVKREGEVFISLIVLCETLWVLEDCYNVHKTELSNILETILKTEQFALENSDIAWNALREYVQHTMDYADCLIATIAKYYNCENTGTFDKKAAKSELFELI